MEYNKFMKIYNLEHKFCPKCNHDSYSTTLVGYIYDQDKPEAYKDLNRCTCSNCGDRHTKHERVSKLLTRDRKINKIIGE